MKFNPNEHTENTGGNYTAPTPGIYTIKVIDGEKTYTKNGDEMWKMKYEIIENGPFFGSLIFENIVFSEKALHRAHLIFAAFDIDMTVGEREYEYFELLDRVCKVNLENENYTDKSGNVKTKAKISFDGYYSLSNSAKKEELEDIPF